MTGPTYYAVDGVIFQRDRAAITLERACRIEGVHKYNAAFWLSLGTICATKRIEMAKPEQGLAAEMAAAIAQIVNSQAEAA